MSALDQPGDPVPTLRQDPTTRQWVILAPRRGERPHDEPTTPPRPPLPARDPGCPLCPGNEDQTPPDVTRTPQGGDWRVRVVPNLFAALGGDGAIDRAGAELYREMPGVGNHEVVIESPRHDARLDQMTGAEVAEVLAAWRARYRTLIARPEIRAVVVFKNFGRLAGTSIVHTHSQIVATPVSLPRLLRRLEVADRYFDEHGRCVYDDVIAAEREAGERLVIEHGGFLAFAPFASGTPFETWIVPTAHGASFGDLEDDDLPDLARTIAEALAALRTSCADPDFNLVLFSAPTNGPKATFHWHLKLLPKLAGRVRAGVGDGYQHGGPRGRRPGPARRAARPSRVIRAARRVRIAPTREGWSHST